MLNSTSGSTSDISPYGRLISQLPRQTTLRRRMRLLKWLVPAGMVLLVVAYELGPSRWTYESLGFNYHLLAEILVFGTIGPLLAFVLLDFLGRWLDERDTADLQAHLLSKAGEKESEADKLCDDTLQVLFATNLLITQIKAQGSDLSSSTKEQIDTTEQALNASIEKLRNHMLS